MRRIMMTAMAVAAITAALADVTGAIRTESGAIQKGKIRWSARDKAYVVTSGGIELQVKPTDVAEMDITKPAGFDKAVEQIEKGQAASAISALQKIVKDYQRLQWDKVAGRYLAQAYVESGKAAEGLKVCQGVISSDPTAAYKGDLAPAYWAALLALDRKAPLRKALDDAAKKGDRYSSGAALIARGDLIYKEGKETADAARQALTDGYLRVVMLYKDAAVAPRLQPEALYKAAQCFEKLGQAARAEHMRSTLKRSYGGSSWAAK